ncbi:unnamed protein product [Macrosiphum euphorbiae]|uniref:Uncharacterized protein n=1 Tax=Macrosiphum euphorbiae TaxID=13131 RepID=A0AAV0VIZ7_9HEMI|nr:unnamed protein product [Macrosiphum euphorbiae]
MECRKLKIERIVWRYEKRCDIVRAINQEPSFKNVKTAGNSVKFGKTFFLRSMNTCCAVDNHHGRPTEFLRKHKQLSDSVIKGAFSVCTIIYAYTRKTTGTDKEMQIYEYFQPSLSFPVQIGKHDQQLAKFI